MTEEVVETVEERKKRLEEEDRIKKEQEKLDKEQKAKAKVEHPDDKITRAEAAADRIEAANKVAAQQLEEQRAIAVNTALGGETAAGTPPPADKEETPAEYKDRVMAGEVEDAKKD